MTVTKIIKLDPSAPNPDDIKFAAEVLKNGGLVVIPTETVYGIAGNMSDAKAMQRLSALKQRPDNKPFSLHIDTPERVEEFAKDIPLAAYKLMAKFWPGPLTLVLNAAKGGTIGIRMPDNEIALQVIAQSGVPVVCPSANLAGKKAPLELEEALKDLNGKVDLALDAGKAKLGKESTVVDMTFSPARVLREGWIKKEEVEQEIAKKHILFVCAGNSCRSVMAEALLKKILKDKNRTGIEVSSAGIMALSGMGATGETRLVLEQAGLDVSRHRSRRVTAEMLKMSDLILVMEEAHREGLLRLAPQVNNRLFLLNEFAKIKGDSLEVEDPIGKTREFYLETFNIIKDAVERIADKI